MTCFTSRTFVAANYTGNITAPNKGHGQTLGQSYYNRNSHASPRFGKEHRRSRQNNPDLCEFARLRIDLD